MRFDTDRRPEHLACNEHGQPRFDHREHSDTLIRLSVRVNDVFFNDSSSRCVPSAGILGPLPRSFRLAVWHSRHHGRRKGVTRGLGNGRFGRAFPRELANQPLRVGGHAHQDVFEIAKRRDLDQLAALDERR